MVLTRNFGHQIALTAGLEFARGRAAITMDADLQHPPALIPRLVEEWRKGALVVSTVRTDTEDIGPFKRLTSRLFYGLINALSKTPVQPDAADFRLLDRRAVEALKSMRERHRFLRGMIGWLGYLEAQVAFSAGKRAGGRSKYTWTRMFSFAADGIVSFSTLPLKAALLLGACARPVRPLRLPRLLHVRLPRRAPHQGLGFDRAPDHVPRRLPAHPPGRTGEYISRIYEEIKARPLSLVKNWRRRLLPSPRAAS